jgi:hypothetical protein
MSWRPATTHLSVTVQPFGAVSGHATRTFAVLRFFATLTLAIDARNAVNATMPPVGVVTPPAVSA